MKMIIVELVICCFQKTNVGYLGMKIKQGSTKGLKIQGGREGGSRTAMDIMT